MKHLLEELLQGRRLGSDEARDLFGTIARNEVPPAQVAALVTIYRMRPITLLELQGFTEAALELAKKPTLSGENAIDVCGTGGDGKNTFNISTATAFVLAACGCRVLKHGSVASSSKSGSSDVLQRLGVPLTDDSETLKRLFGESNLCFLHAPFFHPALKQVGNVRKELGIRSLFNVLGPLINPVQPEYQMVGTASLSLFRLYQSYLFDRRRSFRIVHTVDGYDEVSLTAPCLVASPAGTAQLEPLDFGLCDLVDRDIGGGDSPEESASVIVELLRGTAPEAHTAVVAANTGLGLHCMNPLVDLKSSVQRAREVILSGKGFEVLEKIRGLA